MRLPSCLLAAVLVSCGGAPAAVETPAAAVAVTSAATLDVAGPWALGPKAVRFER